MSIHEIIEEVLELSVENLTQILFSYFAAIQDTTANVGHSMSLSSTESTSIKFTVSSQSDNESVGVSLTESQTPSLATSQQSSKAAFFASSSSSRQNASSSISE